MINATKKQYSMRRTMALAGSPLVKHTILRVLASVISSGWVLFLALTESASDIAELGSFLALAAIISSVNTLRVEQLLGLPPLEARAKLRIAGIVIAMLSAAIITSLVLITTFNLITGLSVAAFTLGQALTRIRCAHLLIEDRPIQSGCLVIFSSIAVSLCQFSLLRTGIYYGESPLILGCGLAGAMLCLVILADEWIRSFRDWVKLLNRSWLFTAGQVLKSEKIRRGMLTSVFSGMPNAIANNSLVPTLYFLDQSDLARIIIVLERVLMAPLNLTSSAAWTYLNLKLSKVSEPIRRELQTTISRLMSKTLLLVSAIGCVFIVVGILYASNTKMEILIGSSILIFSVIKAISMLNSYFLIHNRAFAQIFFDCVLVAVKGAVLLLFNLEIPPIQIACWYYLSASFLYLALFFWWSQIKIYDHTPELRLATICTPVVIILNSIIISLST